MAKVTITGGAGFIGSNLAQRLLREGHDVTIFDNLSRSGGESNIAWLREQFGEAAFRVVRADLTDFEALKRAVEGAERLYHLAGQVAVTTSVKEPRADFEANALGTFNALEAARQVGDDPFFLYTSTNKVYGGMEEIKIVEADGRYAYAELPRGIPETTTLDFHSPYGCCYSGDTDILTRDGWKRFYELGAEDEVLTYNMERQVGQFQRPVAHFAYPYQGKMYVQRDRHLETCVTPNHKMLVASDCNPCRLEEPRLEEAQAIAGQPLAYLLAADVEGGADVPRFALPSVQLPQQKGEAALADESIPLQDWLRFVGWYLAAGHRRQSAARGDGMVALTTSRTAEAASVMEAVGLSPVVEGCQVVAISDPCYHYLGGFGESRADRLPREVQALHPKYLKLLLRALLDGDGERQGEEGWCYRTHSKQLADDVQELALRCGMAASLLRDAEGGYCLSLGTSRTTLCNLEADCSEWVEYAGMVYCVEVPNSVVMVRQNGHAYFSGNSKGAGDQYVRDYHRIYGVRSVVMRQSCIYGYRQFGIEDQGWVAWFIIAALKGRPITIFGDGKQVRDVLFIDDLLDAYEAAVQHSDRAVGQIYNVGGGPDNTMSIWSEFGPLLEELLGRPIPVTHSDWRPGDQPVYISDIDKIQRELGWSPALSVREGVTRLYRWIHDNQHLFAHL